MKPVEDSKIEKRNPKPHFIEWIKDFKPSKENIKSWNFQSRESYIINFMCNKEHSHHIRKN